MAAYGGGFGVYPEMTNRKAYSALVYVSVVPHGESARICAWLNWTAAEFANVQPTNGLLIGLLS